MTMQPSTVHPLYPGLLGIALLCGCATAPNPVHAPPGTDYGVRVEQLFESLPNGTYLNFQHGQRVMPGNLDRWTTYCQLYVYNDTRGADYSTSVLPGTFAISEISLGYRSSDDLGPARFRWLYRGVHDLPAYYVYQVGMRLNSPDQPEVRSLICYKKWNVPRADQYPTLAQMRAALGNQVLIILPPPAQVTLEQPD